MRPRETDRALGRQNRMKFLVTILLPLENICWKSFDLWRRLFREKDSIRREVKR